MIKESPCNIIARKRELVKIKAENNTDVYIKNLVEHLKIFLQDEESIFYIILLAWIELANQYQKINAIKDAIFCYEELIIINPTNYLYVLQIAELYYTLGGQINVKNARNYYMRTTELNSKCAQAYLGICKVLLLI